MLGGRPGVTRRALRLPRQLRARRGRAPLRGPPSVPGNESCDGGNHPKGSADGALEGGLSHEHNEAITDPEPNNAWTDFAGGGNEIGDKCNESNGAALGTAPNGASYNQVIDGHLYWYQEEWSNQTHRCLQK